MKRRRFRGDKSPWNHCLVTGSIIAQKSRNNLTLWRPREYTGFRAFEFILWAARLAKAKTPGKIVDQRWPTPGINPECPSGSPNCFMGNLNCSNGINTTAMFFYRGCGIKGQACNTTYVPTCPPLKNGWDLSKFAGHCYMDKGENPTSGSSHIRASHVQEDPFCWPSGALTLFCVKNRI